jgi:hypothetical protein
MGTRARRVTSATARPLAHRIVWEFLGRPVSAAVWNLLGPQVRAAALDRLGPEVLVAAWGPPESVGLVEASVRPAQWDQVNSEGPAEHPDRVAPADRQAPAALGAQVHQAVPVDPVDQWALPASPELPPGADRALGVVGSPGRTLARVRRGSDGATPRRSLARGPLR